MFQLSFRTLSHQHISFLQVRVPGPDCIVFGLIVSLRLIREIKIDIVINNQTIFPFPVQAGYSERIANYSSNNGFRPISQLIAPVNIQYTMSRANVTLRFSGNRFFNRDAGLNSRRLLSIHKQRDVTSHLTSLVANNLFLGGVSFEMIPPDFVGVMATLWTKVC